MKMVRVIVNPSIKTAQPPYFFETLQFLAHGESPITARPFILGP